MLSIDNVAKSYGSRAALDCVNLQVDRGEVLGLLGRNGAGKTTLLSLLAGLLSPDQGAITLDGYSITESRSKYLQALGFAPQDLAIYPTLTVDANLRFFAELRAVPRREVKQVVGQVAAGLLLLDLLGRKAGQLSGGEQRRLHAAIGLMGRPRYVLLDEPTVGADAETRNQLLSAVTELASQSGTGFIYTSHYTLELEQIADTVAILHDGAIRTTGSVDDIIKSQGRSRLDLSFSQPVAAPAWAGVPRQRVELETENPSAQLGLVLGQLGTSASYLVSADIVRPSLESAYLALTARSDAEAKVAGHDLKGSD